MSIFVFLGPSLTLSEAKDILPEAHYLPPCACGDIVKIMGLKPKVLVIIDGYFENRPSVWHKEILYALSQGVTVYGASSMGALRAAELANFGMMGIGEIYERYRSGDIIDDDEVILTHLSAQEGFEPHTLPMINIRFTVEQALNAGVVSNPIGRKFLAIAKETFYQERTLTILKAKTQHLEGMNSFYGWFENRYVDQKKLDAKKVLDIVKSAPFERPSKIDFSNTALFRNLKIENLSIPLPFFYDWLPIEYRINTLAKLFGAEYELSKQLAKTLGVAHDCGFMSISGQKISFAYPLSDKGLAERFLKCFLSFAGSDYVSDVKEKTLQILAKITAHLYDRLALHFETIDKASFFETVHRFYRKHQIHSKEDFSLWLEERAMSLDEFKAAIELLHFYDYFIVRNNLSTLMESKAVGIHHYFSMAVSLNGLSQKIVETLCIQKETLLHDNEERLATEGDYYAIAQDFTDSCEMREFISKINSLDTACLKVFSTKSWKLQ